MLLTAMEKLYPMLIWISTLTMYASLSSAVILFPFLFWSLGNLYGSEIVRLQNRVYHMVEFKDNFELLLMEFLQNKYEIS